MWDLLHSLLFAGVMVPLVMAIILGMVYGLGELFNFISHLGVNKKHTS